MNQTITRHPFRPDIPLLNRAEQQRLLTAGRVAAATLDTVCHKVRAGWSTLQIDRLVRLDTANRGATPSQLGYHGFPAAVCTSRNEVVCHGIPSRWQRLRPGDIVNIDITSCIGGFHGDTSRTIVIGEPSAEAAHVVQTASRALQAGIDAVRPGGQLGDIGAAITTVAKAHGCSVVRDFGGHGIGTQMHLPPHVDHTVGIDADVLIVPGMAFTIEPMINLGGPGVVLKDDGWTVVTADGRLSAQFEHTILVTEDGPLITTPRPTTGP